MSESDVLTLHQEQDAFGRLPKERREAIARASIEAFGRNDYKGHPQMTSHGQRASPRGSCSSTARASASYTCAPWSISTTRP